MFRMWPDGLRERFIHPCITETGRQRIQRYRTRNSWFWRQMSKVTWLHCQNKKVNSCSPIPFSVLTSLFAHQIYKVLEDCNRKNVHQLTFREHKLVLFGWQRALLFGLAYETIRNVNTWVHLFGAKTFPFGNKLNHNCTRIIVGGS